MTTCERCQAKVPAGSFALFDYCVTCNKNLCDSCMKKGCCGVEPAASGMEADEEDDDDD